MTLFSPVYRMTIFETDGITPLTPRSGSPHSLEFKVATASGLAGYQPYMGFPSGRRSSIDLLDRKTSIGELSIDVLDKRLSSASNLERFVTAYMGDSNGRLQFLDKPVLIEERLDGSTWTSYFRGFVFDMSLSGPLWMRFNVREMGEEMKAECFVGRPHPSVTYADGSSLLPLGPAIDYGGFSATPPIPASLQTWTVSGYGSGHLLVTRKAAIRTDDLYTMLTTVHPPLAAVLQKEPLHLRPGAPGTTKEHPDIHIDLFGADGGAYIGSYAVVRIPMQPLGGGTPLFLAYVQEVDGPRDTRAVRKVGIAPLPTTDPRYAAIPAIGDYEFRLVNKGTPTEDAPLFIESVHPVELAGDLLAGKFGRFDENGDPLRVMPTDAANVAALAADYSGRINSRFRIGQRSKVNEFLEQQICKPFSYVYRIDLDGEVQFVDVRLPSTSAGLLTITDTDLATTPAPGWSASREGAIAETRIGYYVDTQDEPYLAGFRGLSYPIMAKPTWIFEYGGFSDGLSHDHVVIDSPGFGRSEPYEIEAKGLRYSDGVEDLGEYVAQQIKVGTYLSALTEVLRSLFSGGLAETTLTCRRTANTEDCLPGDMRIVDVDVIPNAASNIRGGPRVAICVERTEDGPRLLLKFIDMGADAVAVSPSIGTPTLVSGRGSEAVQATVTLNAQGEPAVAWVCPTATSVGTIPADDDPRWIFGARTTVTGAVVVGGLPSGSRIWVRARSEPTGEVAMKLPSPWVKPSGTKFVDTTGLAAPTGLAIDYQTGSEAGISFTPGIANLPVQMFVDGVQKDTLPAGSTLAVFRALPTGSRTLGLRHSDGLGGFSSLSTIAVTIGGALQTCPDMVGIGLAVGEAG